jgi:hypothetical protein
MPLTPFQKGAVRALIANRTPESHLAGGVVSHRAVTGLRFSDDLDIFHDVAASVAASAEADAKSLQEAGYSVDRPVTPDPESPDFATLVRHRGSIRGAWPRIA